MNNEERRRKDLEEREKAIARDSVPYNASEMPPKIPLGCLVFLLGGFGALLVIAARILKLLIWNQP